MTYPEPLVARTTGVNRETVAAARKSILEKGTDWTLENSVVCYSADGLKKLLRTLGLAEAPFVWPDAGNATGDPAATPLRFTSVPQKISVSAGAVAARVAAAGVTAAARPLVDLRVTTLSRNPSIVHASADGGRTLVLVRVRTNVNFTAGMLIRARAPGPGGTLYHFEGQCPRWKGRY